MYYINECLPVNGDLLAVRVAELVGAAAAVLSLRDVEAAHLRLGGELFHSVHAR